MTFDFHQIGWQPVQQDEGGSMPSVRIPEHNYAVSVSEFAGKILDTTSALPSRPVSGSADHSEADRTSDRVGAPQA
jgi:tRNA A37 threonylcarbamoyladenosine synthetase subunit TsaC/SUA5/YrdC